MLMSSCITKPYKPDKTWLVVCGGPFVLLGFDFSCYTTTRDSKIGELELA